MSWQMLDQSTARSHGATVAEEVIQTVCVGCSKANLDFDGPEFCPVQVAYGWDGEHPAIQYEEAPSGFYVRCTQYEVDFEPSEPAPCVLDGQMSLEVG